MTFTMPNFPLLNFDQANPALTGAKSAQDMISNFIKQRTLKTQAKYAPQMAQADIFNKEFSPLAQFSISPMALALADPQRQQILQYMTSLLGQVSGNNPQSQQSPSLGGLFSSGQNQSTPPSLSPNMPNMPAPSGGNGSPNGASGMDMGANDRASPAEVKDIAAHGNNAYSNGNDGMAPSEQSTSNLPQAGQGTGAGFAAHALSSSNTQIYPAGTTYFDPKSGQYRSAASNQLLNEDQVAMGAIQGAIPYMKKLQDDANKVLVKGKIFKYLSSFSASALENLGADPKTLKTIGISPDYYNDYIQFRKDIANASERLGVAYKFGNTDTGRQTSLSIIEPGHFQLAKDYNKSVDKEISNLINLNKVYKSHITGGLNVSPGANPEIPRQTSYNSKVTQNAPQQNGNEGIVNYDMRGTTNIPESITYNNKKYTKADIIHTATQNHISPKQLLQMLGVS